MAYTELDITRLIAIKNLERLLVVDANGYMALSWLLHQTENDDLIYDLLAFLESRFEGKAICSEPGLDKIFSVALYEVMLLLGDDALSEVAPELLAAYQAGWELRKHQVRAALNQPAPAATPEQDPRKKLLVDIIQYEPFALEAFYGTGRADVLFPFIATDATVASAVSVMMGKRIRECWLPLFQVKNSADDALLIYLIDHSYMGSSLSACINLSMKLLSDCQIDEAEDSVEQIVGIFAAKGGLMEVPFLARLFLVRTIDELSRKKLSAALRKAPDYLRVLLLQRILIPDFRSLTNSSNEPDIAGLGLVHDCVVKSLTGLAPEDVESLLSSPVAGELFLTHLFQLEQRLEGVEEGVAKIFSELRDCEQIFLLKKLESLEQEYWMGMVSYLLPHMKKSACAFLMGSILEVSMETSPEAVERRAFLRPLVEKQDDWEVMIPLLKAYDILTRPEKKGLAPSRAKREQVKRIHQAKDALRSNLIQKIKDVLHAECDFHFVQRIADLMAYIHECSQEGNWSALIRGATSRNGGAVRVLNALTYQKRIKRKEVIPMLNAITFTIYERSDPDGFKGFIESGGEALFDKMLQSAGAAAMILLVHCGLRNPDLFDQIIVADTPQSIRSFLTVAKCYVALLKLAELDGESECLKTLLEDILQSPQLTSFGSAPVLQLTYYLYKLTHNEAMAEKKNRYDEIIPKLIGELLSEFPADMKQLVAMMQTEEFLRDGLVQPVSPALRVASPISTDEAATPPVTLMQRRSRRISLRSTPVASPRTPRVHQVSTDTFMSAEQRARINARRLMIHLKQQPVFLMDVLANPVAKVAFFQAIQLEPQGFYDLLKLIRSEDFHALFALVHPESGWDMLSFIAASERAGSLLPAALDCLQQLGEEAIVEILSTKFEAADHTVFSPVERVITDQIARDDEVSPADLLITRLMAWFKGEVISAENMMRIPFKVIVNPAVYSKLDDELFLAILAGSIERLDHELLTRLEVVVARKFPHYRPHYAAAKAKAFLTVVSQERGRKAGFEFVSSIAPHLDAILKTKFTDKFICEPAYIALTDLLRQAEMDKMSAIFKK